MAILDDLPGKGGERNRPLTKQEAVAGILLAMAYADGSVAATELRLLVDTLDRMKLFDGVDRERLEQMCEGIYEQVKTPGPFVFITGAVQACSPELRETVFALATDMMLVDGTIHEKERELLGQWRLSVG